MRKVGLETIFKNSLFRIFLNSMAYFMSVVDYMREIDMRDLELMVIVSLFIWKLGKFVRCLQKEYFIV